MWYLTSDTDQRILYVIPNKEITVGRNVDAQVGNFAIPDDASISRKHATLSIAGVGLYLQDLGSRYGTFVNDEKIETSDKVLVKDNDIIKFGKLNSLWRVHQARFVTCTSTLKGENLQQLKVCLATLGGTLKNEWDESCVYLTMPGITLTIKVVLALAQASHIVTIEFWKKCIEAVNKNAPLPDPANFVPQVVESTLNKDSVSFLPNAFRRTLFANKTIVFFSRRQLEMYKVVLTKCSGNPLLLSETKMTKAALCDPNVIVVQYNHNSTSQETQAQKDQINDIVTYLKSKDKRVVADAEIGLAILSCSLDKYCNADFNYSSEVLKPASGQNKTANVLAQESQEPTQKIQKENIVINESLTPSSAKRKLAEDEDTSSNATKKFAGQITENTTTNESVKRKHDDTQDSINPSKKMAVENEDDNMFNFLNNSTENKTQNNTDKLLSFTKPVQSNPKKASNNEDDLFNFVQDKKDSGEANNGIFTSKDENDTGIGKGLKRKMEDDNIDVAAMRGSKLKELQNNMNEMANIKIKKEEPDDLNEKMNDLDLGTTVIKYRSDLIVKKEPIEILESENKTEKNFKKFKKVWPIKVHMKIIPRTTMSIIIPDSVAEEITSQSY